MGRQKVKSGCKTCKIRKIKCDEEFPVCRRCSSTGRSCDGYGIWGGGGHHYSQARRPHAVKPRIWGAGSVVLPPPKHLSLVAIGPTEGHCLDWFRLRTSVKLPASCPSEFWSTLALQASFSEPAILHALVALGSAHRDGVLSVDEAGCTGETFGDSELSLHHYAKAVRTLQPRLDPRKKGALRVALITCIIFSTFDLLRGHHNTAELHLRNGLHMIRSTQPPQDSLGDERAPFASASSFEPVDTLISQAFSRFHLQFALLKSVHGQPCIVLQSPRPIFHDPPSKFSSFKEAWIELEWYLSATLRLTDLSRNDDTASRESLQRSQRGIRTGLVQWLAAYAASETALGRHDSHETAKAYLLVPAFHAMATIMNEVALAHPGRIEDAYDAQTALFARILDVFASMRYISTDDPLVTGRFAGPAGTMARSIIDLGCIQPLYFVALKCRVSEVRRKVVQFLLATHHREGIWDSRVAGEVAKKIIDIEECQPASESEVAEDEGDDERNRTPPMLDEDGEGKSVANPRHVSTQRSPMATRGKDLGIVAHRRVTRSELIMSGEPVSQVHLACHTTTSDGDTQQVYAGVYCISSHSWSN